MFRRKKKESAFARVVRNIRECYVYCKIYLAEQVAGVIGRKYMAQAERIKGSGIAIRWSRFKVRMTARKFFAQAAICRYARKTGTYKNL